MGIKKQITYSDFVSVATGLQLHRFTWLDDDDIGALDVRWNWLVGEYDDPPSDVKMFIGLMEGHILKNLKM